MKTVVTSSMVAHLWAHQSQPRARNAGDSFSFDGPVLYSYATPIAMLHKTRAGTVALVASERYSVTTQSRHKPEMWHAMHFGIVQRFSVPYVGATGGWAPSFSRCDDGRKDWHAPNLAHLVAEYNELGGRIRRAAYTYHSDRDSVQRALQGAADIVTAYCDAFRIPKRARPVFDPADDARVIWRAREIRDERARDPKTIAKRERAKALKEAREAAAREARARERFERDKMAREAFRAGRGHVWHVYDERGGALLRVDSDGMVRTSLGAECPADDARRAFAILRRQFERAGFEPTAAPFPDAVIWRPAGSDGVKLGSFALSEIRANGTIRAGCHTIHWPEIEAAARALGLLRGEHWRPEGCNAARLLD